MAFLISGIFFVIKRKEMQNGIGDSEEDPKPRQKSNIVSHLRKVDFPPEIATRFDKVLWILYKNRYDIVRTSALADSLGMARTSTLNILRDLEIISHVFELKS